jgi:hypothetical protein
MLIAHRAAEVECVPAVLCVRISVTGGLCVHVGVYRRRERQRVVVSVFCCVPALLCVALRFIGWSLRSALRLGCQTSSSCCSACVSLAAFTRCSQLLC